MSEYDPYRQPDAELVVSRADGSIEIHAPVRRSIGHGWVWIRDAYTLYSQSWGKWILAWLLVTILSLGIQYIPFIGALISLVIGPLFYAGIINLAHRADIGEPVDISEVFAGFTRRSGPLLLLGVVYFLMILGIVVVLGIVGFVLLGPEFRQIAHQAGSDPESAGHFMQALMAGPGALKVLLLVLIYFLLLIPVLAAYWFSPALIFLGERGVGQALKESFSGCFRNWLPYLWYSIIAILLFFAGVLPFLLGLLIVVPVLMISNYTAFRSIYVDQ